MSALRAAREWAARSTLAHVGFGFIAMGAWAVFANRDHPLAQALVAGLVQGTISGLLTLVLKKALEAMSRLMGRRHAPALLALIAPPMTTAASILAILVTAHTLARTPEIAATIAVPFAVSTTYAILYNLRLWRDARGRR